MSTTEAPAVEESLSAHATRVLRARLRAAAAGVLDPCIARLQQLRGAIAGAPGAEGGDDGGKSRRDRPGGRNDAKDGDAPAPKGRLLARLINLCMILAGGMAGGALAYNLFEDMLDQKAAENARMQASVAEHSKTLATAQEELAAAQAKLSETAKKLEGSAVAAVEKKLEEAQAKRAETEKKLEEAQAGRIEAEKKLAASIADQRASAAEKKTRLDEAVKLLATLSAEERAAKAEPPGRDDKSGKGDAFKSANIGGNGNAGGKARAAPRTGNCDLKGGNAAALKDCVAEFNRQ